MGGRTDGHARGNHAGWAGAWRGLRASPLPAYWRLAEQRSTLKGRWWARSPTLVIFGVLISAIATLGEVTLLRELLWVSGSVVATPAYARSVIVSGVILLAGAAGTFAYLWLLARCYQLLYAALSFLGTGAGRPPPVVLDDELAASPQTDQEVVVGFAAFGLRKVLLPLLVVCASIGLLKLCLDFTPLATWGFDGGAIARQYGVLAGAGVAILLIAELLISGTLAALALMLLCVPLSLGRRTMGGSAIGALLATVFQLVVIVIAVRAEQILTPGSPGPHSIEDSAVAVAVSAILLVPIVAAFLLSRHVKAIRLVLRYAIGAIMAYLAAGAYALAYMGHGAAQEALAVMAAPFSAFILVSPMMPLDPLIAAAQKTPEGAVLFAQLEHWLIGLGIQLLIVVALTLFARGAVRARRSGAA